MKGAIMLSGGGSGKLFAAIGVTYPSGSTVTCTNGTKTLTAKTTSGQWVFAIPKAGTWTVTATDGTNTKSQSVSITAEGQFESVMLAYWNGELYDAGNEYTATTGGWTSVITGIGSVTKNTDHLYVSTGTSSNTAQHVLVDAVTTNTVDLSNFSKLKMTISEMSGAGGGAFYLYATAASGKAWVSGVPSTQFTAKGTIALDVSGLSGKYYVGCHLGPFPNYWVKITKMWLE